MRNGIRATIVANENENLFFEHELHEKNSTCLSTNGVAKLLFNKLTFSLLLHVPYHLMAVGSSVFTAANVNPVVLVVGGLQDELVEIRVVLNEVHPAIMVHGSWLMVHGSISVHDPLKGTGDRHLSQA